jgi:hypothetical protein
MKDVPGAAGRASWTSGSKPSLADVLALAGEEPEAVREKVRVALADCEAIFRAQETHKRMKDKAAHAWRALCRARVAEELQRRGATRASQST